MAFFQVNFFSPVLGFPSDIQVYVPTPYSDDELNDGDKSFFTDDAAFPVLYLLHGAYGDYTDWARLTGIERYAHSHRMAVVMPSVSNSFYQDMVRGSACLSYLTEDLMPFVEKNFPVSTKREDTFAAGLSMGGYGALRLALEKPERFAACASLSGAIDLEETYAQTQRGDAPNPFNWGAVLGDPAHIAGSDADLFALIRRLKEQKRPLPRIYQTIGTEDFLYEMNLGAKKKLEDLGVDLTYAEHPGIHDWIFWDTYIRDVLNWMVPRS